VTVEEKQFYNFFVAVCPYGDEEQEQPSEFTVRNSYTFLSNSEGAHLSIELLPLPQVFLVFMGLWALTVLLWCYNWVQHMGQQNVLLQRMLTFVPAFKILATTLLFVYYASCLSNGTYPSSVRYLYLFVYVLYQAAFYTSLLLISKGWLITRSVLTWREYRSTCGVVVTYAVTFLHFLLSRL